MHEVLAKLQRELADGLSGLTAEQTQMRRTPGAWSIQQIVEHLVMSYESTTAVFEGRLHKGTPTKGTADLRQRVGQFVVTTLGMFPKGHKAPEMVTPVEPTVRAMSAIELNARLAEILFPMDAAMAEAARVFGEKTRAVTHARLGPMTVAQWRRFHFIHGEHHLRQILATRRAFQI